MKFCTQFLLILHRLKLAKPTKFSWLTECLSDTSIPPPIDLEENFRNGVLLAQLGHYFAPEIVPHDKIFDIDQVLFEICTKDFLANSTSQTVVIFVRI